MEMFALYDTKRELWYTRSNWRKKPFVWRQKGPMKLALLEMAPSYHWNSEEYKAERSKFKELCNDMRWDKATKLINADKVAQLPETYQIWKYTDNGPVFVTLAKDWYLE